MFVVGAPIAFYFIRTVRRLIVYPDQSLFYTEEEYQFAEKSFSEMFLDFNFLDDTYLSYLFDIFFFQFNWVWVLLLVATLAFGVKRRRSIASCPSTITVLLLLLATVYLSTRHRPFNHIRYVLPTLPLFLLSTYALVKNRIHSRVFATFCGLMTLLSAVSNYSSVDPVSSAYFGRISLGDYSVYNMARFFYQGTPESPTFNRDELAYNFQFMYHLRAAEEAFRMMNPDGHTTIMGSRGSKFFWPDFIDASTFRRVGRRSENVFRVHYFDQALEFSRIIDKPERFSYIEFPQFFAAGDLREVLMSYREESSTDVSYLGYRVTVRTLRQRELP